MNWLIFFHVASYGTALLIIAVFALTYATRSQFMPYHAAAIERPWHTLDAPLQLLLLALVRLVGWGWLAIASAGLVMLYQLFILRFITVAVTGVSPAGDNPNHCGEQPSKTPFQWITPRHGQLGDHDAVLAWISVRVVGHCGLVKKGRKRMKDNGQDPGWNADGDAR